MPASEPCRRVEQLLDPAGDRLGLAHPAGADLTFRELARLRADELDSARTQSRCVRLSRLVLPHAGVHRRRDEHRAAVRERRLGENVVGEPVRELRQRVRRERGDHEQVGALEVRVGIGARRLACEREERLRPDKAVGGRSRQRQHVMTRLDEKAHELAGLVGRDAAGDPEQDARHRAHCADFPRKSPRVLRTAVQHGDARQDPRRVASRPGSPGERRPVRAS